MKWHKLGRLYAPDGAKPWMRAYAANPVPEHLHGDRYRIYFSSRDDRNRSSVSFIEIDLAHPSQILHEAEDPVLGPGDAGTFDDCGVSIGCLVPVGVKRYLYYMGWHLTETVPWRNTIGLAISDGPDRRFERASPLPILGLDDVDPFTLSYPWVCRDGDRFRMWYGSNTSWGPHKDDMRHVIKYAESSDGIQWDRQGRIAVDFAHPGEYALSRPCVVASDGGFRMWFSARGESYRIHCAESSDGLVWHRTADGGLDVSEAGWDADMVEYPCIFDHRGVRYMLYTGNGFGRTGFGLARLDRAQMR